MMRQRDSIQPSFFRGLIGIAFLSLSSAWAAQVGTVFSEQKISETAGGFGGVLELVDTFGSSLAPLGDLDGDGNVDLAVGAASSRVNGAANQGAVWIVFLNADGTVAAQQEISEKAGGFGGTLDGRDFFGVSVAALGDLDGDGNQDLAVGADQDDDGGMRHGAVWILFLNAGGTVASEQKISATSGGFGGVLDEDFFGASVSSLGDLDGDGNQDLAVGAVGDDDGGVDQGAVWILFLNADGTVASEQKISETAGGFGGVLDAGDLFGRSVCSLGDLDGDGNPELAVGADRDGDGGMWQGAVWILSLNADGTVASEQKISETQGGFGGVLDPGEFFGASVCSLGDLDGDGNQELAVGAWGDEVGGSPYGAVWILFLNSDGTVASEHKISATTGGFGGVLDLGDVFGGCVAPLGDLDGDGNQDLAVGASGDDDGGVDQGAVWVLFLKGIPTPPPRFKRWLDPVSSTEWPTLALRTSTSGPEVARRAGLGSDQVPRREDAHGGASLRNGSGANEMSLVSAATPHAGKEWQARVDVSLHPDASASLVIVCDRSLRPTPTPFGELLVDVLSREPLFTSLVRSSGAIDVHTLRISGELLGRSIALQALVLDGGASALTNAVDLVIGP